MNLTEATAYTDRDGIVDAVTRLVEGIDFGNEELLRSAFTEDAVFDLGGIDHSIHAFEPYVGREQVVRTLMETVGTAMDTFHALSNIRVLVDGDTATLTCYLIGQHHRTSQGPSVEFQDHLLLGNRFETDLVRDHGRVWRVRHNRVSSRWSVGNPAAGAIPTEK
ncbi:nuclear transport factor 2 family protein [Nocardia australiensis]|uniref:nuclear transport factor 2 family protein n=1 Tax=Nocardia australiensis TaxID=2887191 RepID=UPI001D15D570|nr:nuclear transport factor 2 family protein [Nocardia australiensis]